MERISLHAANAFAYQRYHRHDFLFSIRHPFVARSFATRSFTILHIKAIVNMSKPAATKQSSWKSLFQVDTIPSCTSNVTNNGNNPATIRQQSLVELVFFFPLFFQTSGSTVFLTIGNAMSYFLPFLRLGTTLKPAPWMFPPSLSLG